MLLDQKDIILPRRIKPGDTIGIVAPASPFERKAFEQGVAAIRNAGFQTKIHSDLFVCKGYLAGDDHQRAAQLNQMFADDRVGAIMCARGGFGALKILPYLDYRLIRSKPKPFMGFSDITALHQAVFLKAGVVTFHGPLVTTLATADRDTQSAWRQALCGGATIRIKANHARIIKPGMSQGIVKGGNLTTLCHMLGTPFADQYKDCLLLIEDAGEAPYRIDRMLTQMTMADCFSGVKGIIMGTFTDCGRQSEIEQLVHQCFERADIPIVGGFDVGHTARNLTVAFGAEAQLNADKAELAFLSPVTTEG